jgi:hypothetical protein
MRPGIFSISLLYSQRLSSYLLLYVFQLHLIAVIDGYGSTMSSYPVQDGLSPANDVSLVFCSLLDIFLQYGACILILINNNHDDDGDDDNNDNHNHGEPSS